MINFYFKKQSPNPEASYVVNHAGHFSSNLLVYLNDSGVWTYQNGWIAEKHIADEIDKELNIVAAPNEKPVFEENLATINWQNGTTEYLRVHTTGFTGYRWLFNLPPHAIVNPIFSCYLEREFRRNKNGRQENQESSKDFFDRIMGAEF